MEHYEYFGNALISFKQGILSGVEFQDLFPDRHWDFKYMVDRALNLFPKAIVFEVDEDLKKTCALHKAKSKSSSTFLPHNPMFLDVKFAQEEYGDKLKSSSVIGILLTESPLHREDSAGFKKFESEGAIGKAINAITVSFRSGKVWLDSATFNYEIFDGKKHHITHKKVPEGNFIANFVNNVLTFINDPEIQLIRTVRGEKNIQRRLKMGKMPLPDSLTVKLNGELKRYVTDFAANVHHGTAGWHYNYRFPVRAHVRRYRDKKTLEIIKEVKVEEYMKGQGPLITKKYELEAKTS
jgi:hypothetical protein